MRYVKIALMATALVALAAGSAHATWSANQSAGSGRATQAGTTYYRYAGPANFYSSWLARNGPVGYGGGCGGCSSPPPPNQTRY